jgi:hypothetical protein
MYLHTVVVVGVGVVDTVGVGVVLHPGGRMIQIRGSTDLSALGQQPNFSFSLHSKLYRIICSIDVPKNFLSNSWYAACSLQPSLTVHVLPERKEAYFIFQIRSHIIFAHTICCKYSNPEGIIFCQTC